MLRYPEKKDEKGTPISASNVRRLLDEKKWDEIKNIVPETTYNYLVKKYQPVFKMNF